MGCEYHRMQVLTPLNSLPVLDTCTETTASLCQLPGGRGGKFKLPTLTELHQYLFKTPFAEAHNATADVEATSRCFLELLRRGTYSTEQLQASTDYLQEFQTQNPDTIAPLGLKHINLKKAASALVAVAKKTDAAENKIQIADVPAVLLEAPVVHLHNHSQFSILQSTISIKKLVKATADAGMTSVALTDHGNMMGAFHFVKEIRNYNKSLVQQQKDAEASGEEFDQKPIKPIIGCEFFVCDDHSNKSQKDNGYQIVFLAKNKRGYQNLVKMSSLAFTDGFYYLPRIDRKIVETYKQDLIVLSGNLYGEVPSKVLNVGEKQAEEALIWWKAQFGEDFYIELMRHGQEDEDRVNPVLIQFSKKHNIPLVATNNTYYIDQTC
jgi:DNA polymerase-3 subunit alpha